VFINFSTIKVNMMIQSLYGNFLDWHYLDLNLE